MPLRAPPEKASAQSRHMSVVTCDRPVALNVHQRGQGIQSLIHCPVPVHRQPPCASLLKYAKALVASERIAATCRSQPYQPRRGDDTGQHEFDAVSAFASS
jgi:hypothetical protein